MSFESMAFDNAAERLLYFIGITEKNIQKENFDFGCGRISKKTLKGVADDLIELGKIMTENWSLFETREATGGTIASFKNPSPEAIRVLIEQVNRNEHMSRFVSALLARYYQAAAQQENFKIHKELRTDIMATVAKYGTNRSYGIALAAEASELFLRDVPGENLSFSWSDKVRARNLYTEAISHHPLLSDAYMQLTFIHLSNNECTLAQLSSIRAVLTTETNTTDALNVYRIINELIKREDPSCQS